MVIEAHGNSSYTLKVDGTGRVTRRTCNRRYLWRLASLDITNQESFTKHLPTSIKKMPHVRADSTPSAPTLSVKEAPVPSTPSVQPTSLIKEAPAQQQLSLFSINPLHHPDGQPVHSHQR